jgi:class 3 adenylate cyclase
VDALGAAIEFQQTMKEVNRDQPEDTLIVFRMGLHLGDLIVDGDDLYGDGVNVAARLEAEAPAGGIIISRTVHEAVEGRLKATFEDLDRLGVHAHGCKSAWEWRAQQRAESLVAPGFGRLAKSAIAESSLTLPFSLPRL